MPYNAPRGGPALVTFGKPPVAPAADTRITLWPQGPVSQSEEKRTFDVASGFAPVHQRRNAGSAAKVSFTMMGHVNAITGLFSRYGGAAPVRAGTILSDDTPLVLHTQDGFVRAYRNAVLSGSTTLKLSTQSTLGGSLSFDCLCGNEKLPQDADAIFTDSTESFAFPDHGLAGLPSQLYTLGFYNGNTLQGSLFHGLQGVDLSINVQTKAEAHDAKGPMAVVRYADTEVSASLIPSGDVQGTANFEDWVQSMLALQGHASAALGAPVGHGWTLRINGSGLFVRLHGASLVSSDQTNSADARRQGQVRVVCDRRNASAGVFSAPFYIGAVAPSSET